MTDIVISCDRVTKSFQSGNSTLTVVKDLSLAIRQSETCAIVGPSGSGKSTLLTLLAGLDRPTSGEVTLAQRSLNSLSEAELARHRSKEVGFVFQSFQLLPGLTALENVMLPLEILGRDHARNSAEALLDRVGLLQRLHHYPIQLSGGEQQRVALARAFIHKPSILFADEPTGNLDPANAAIALEALRELNTDAKTAIVMVTHDHNVAATMSRIIELRNGSIVSN